MFLQRIVGVFRLQVATFEDIEHDSRSISQATLVVLMAALFSGLGDSILASLNGFDFWDTFLSIFLWTILSWFVWSVITFLVGTVLFKGTARLAEMMRVLGFAFAPLMLSIVPGFGAFVGGIWTLAAAFLAVRQGLDLDDFQTSITILVGFVLYVVGRVLFFFLLA
jgi:hypothetical protein